MTQPIRYRVGEDITLTHPCCSISMVTITTVRLDYQSTVCTVNRDAAGSDCFDLRSKLNAAYGNFITCIANIAIAIGVQNIPRHVFSRICHLHTNAGAQIQIQYRTNQSFSSRRRNNNHIVTGANSFKFPSSRVFKA
ncbi:Uncharacterised protein [Klebsiella pneumoniae]|nr:Uncharacterised protein [Klebsiella pneumoniae]